MSYLASNKSLFIKFLVTYLLILFISLLIGITSYNMSMKGLKQNLLNTNKKALEQTQTIFDQHFSTIEHIVDQLLVDSSIQQISLLDNPYEGKNIYKVSETINKMYDYGLSNSFIYDYYVAYGKNQLVVSSKKAYHLEEFYDIYYKKDDLNYEQWYNLLFNQYHNKSLIPLEINVSDSIKKPILAYVQSIGYYFEPKGVVIVFIDQEKVMDILKGLDLSDKGGSFILDQRDNVISSTGTTDIAAELGLSMSEKDNLVIKSYQDEQVLIGYTTSAFNQCSYVTVQSLNSVMKPVENIKKNILIMDGIILLLGLMIACFMASKNLKPLHTLIHDNAYLKSLMEKQRPILKATFFERLLTGKFNKEHEIMEQMKHAEVCMDNEEYRVILIQLRGLHPINEFSTLNEEKLLIMQTVLQQKMDGLNLHEMGDDTFSVLLGYNEESEVKITTLIEKIKNFMLCLDEIKVMFSMGNNYSRLLDIHRSYEEALQGLDYLKWQNDQDIIWYDQIPKISEGYYYPPEIEQRLIHTVKSGDYIEVEKIFRELYQENIVRRQLSTHVTKLFLYEMWGSMIKIVDQLPIDDMDVLKEINNNIKALDDMDDIDKLQSSIKVYEYLCKKIHEKKKSHNKVLAGQIQKYVHDNYKSPEMSLTLVAWQFQISEAYLSQFFKEQVGENFSVYLQKLRMEQAKYLLMNTDLSVKNIAMETGYNSSNTFGKAFKRYFGMNASELRKM